MQKEKQLHISVKTFKGLEEELAKEIRELGGSHIEVGNRVVHTRGDLGFIYKLTYNLRTALRVLFSWKKVFANDTEELYQALNKLPWTEILSVKQSFRIDVIGTSECFPHTQFARQRAKDAIVDHFRDQVGDRPNVDVINPEIALQVYVFKNEVSILLDASGFSLHKRSYRKGRHPAPLNEVLAAGIVKMVNWNELGTLIDPMCGSGTLLIEAAWNSFNIPPQVLNTQFAFMNWPNFDPHLWSKIQQVSMDKMKDIYGNFFGFDMNKKAVESARINIREAKVNEEVPVIPKNFFQLTAEDNRGVLVFNPPYDERLEQNDPDFYASIGDRLKQEFQGYEAWVFTGNLEAAKHIGLRPSRRISLQNGDIDCKLFKFELYAGSKKHRNE